MATIHPNMETIKRLKQPATPGELHLLNYMQSEFEKDADVYFQPYLNGDRPDIIVVKEGVGAIVIEVKDWALANYEVDSSNKWRVRKNNALIKSPMAQAYTYKKNLFDLHVNGMLEKHLKDKRFFGLIGCFVYFHGVSKPELEALYGPAVSDIKEKINDNAQKFKDQRITHEQYEKTDDYLKNRLKKFERDRDSVAVLGQNIRKIKFPSNGNSALFDYSIYREFLRVLSPPFHTASEGMEITYTKKQQRLIESGVNKRMKVCGIAGSGKTMVLAGRAVNAYKRHKGQVLILTYNLTLCSYIKDRLNKVREDFPWGVFEIINYHKFMAIALNNAGISVSIPDEIRDKDAYFEQHYFSNLSVFENVPPMSQYDTILIDEIQDYRPEWIKMIRDNFLSPNGEMVLFGDEKQNIYGRPVDNERKSKLVEGFGRWEKLTQSFRYQQDSHILSLAQEFQRKFLSSLYEFDSDEAYQPSLNMLGINAYEHYPQNDVSEFIADRIIKVAKLHDIHPNDITVLSSQEKLLQAIDKVIRTSPNHRERTLTTFPTLEADTHNSYKKEREKIGNSKKYAFNLNSGVMKLSTIHSFKGFESPTVFLLINEKDRAEMVYTGLTRAKENIIVFFDASSAFAEFFERELTALSEVTQSIDDPAIVYTTSTAPKVISDHRTPESALNGH